MIFEGKYSEFWITKHGIKANGMPAWGPTHDDERMGNGGIYAKATCINTGAISDIDGPRGGWNQSPLSNSEKWVQA